MVKISARPAVSWDHLESVERRWAQLQGGRLLSTSGSKKRRGYQTLSLQPSAAELCCCSTSGRHYCLIQRSSSKTPGEDPLRCFDDLRRFPEMKPYSASYCPSAHSGSSKRKTCCPPNSPSFPPWQVSISSMTFETVVNDGRRE